MATYVLLHGAYQGGWIWQRVSPHLRARGHTVFVPTLDGCAERRHALRPGIDTESQADEIAEMLFFEDLHDVVLVVTSCGGMVAARVAETVRDRIGRIVLADALALFNGETVADHVKRPTAVTSDVATGPSHEDAANRMFVSLERRMHCGMGKCCRCNVGSTYTCTDGPVFDYWTVMNLKEAI